MVANRRRSPSAANNRVSHSIRFLFETIARFVDRKLRL
jgi:hypothetical protein